MKNRSRQIPITHGVCRAAYLNAFCWGLGTGLFSAHLLRYLVRDLCAGPASAYLAATFAWIVAAPRLTGVFRLFVPTLLEIAGNRKRFCVASFGCSAIVLGSIPLLLPGWTKHFRDTDFVVPLLTMLIVFWCLYHLALYCGNVALFSWYGDLVPKRLRGRFFGRREAWMIAGVALGSLAGGLYSYFVIDRLPPDAARWKGYLVPARTACVALAFSVPFLFFIPEVRRSGPDVPLFRRLRSLLAPLNDRRFAAFVFFGCWVQMSQALTQGVQYGFSVTVLGISMLTTLTLSTTTRLGQWGIGSVTGRMLDRLGSAPVMMLSLLLAATGSLFYYFAETETRWLLFGAAIVWVFWVGVNIGVTKTILDLAPKADNSGYLAVYYTLTALAFAVFSVLGGHLIPKGFEKASFLWSFELRLAAVPILWLVFRIKCTGNG